MPAEEPPRSAAARAAAETALIRVVRNYGGTPEFVLLGGLVPALLCAASGMRHAGTTDVDIQVDLEISSGAVNAPRLERALRAAGFVPDDERVWRWTAAALEGPRTVVKFELLTDLDTAPAGSTVTFDGCENLGAANLRGTGFAARDNHRQTLSGVDRGQVLHVDVNVTGIAGFLLAKVAAAHGRHKPKDWYDIAFVLLHNDIGDAHEIAAHVGDVFGAVTPTTRTQLLDLRANFENPNAQGVTAYVEQITTDHPELDPHTAAADSQLAVHAFCRDLLEAFSTTRGSAEDSR